MEHNHNPFWAQKDAGATEHTFPPQSAQNVDEMPLPRGRVAVVEDGESTRHFLVQRLRAEGYQVKGIEDGASALPLLRLQNPDVILLDVSLPGVSGFEVCRQIRSDAQLQQAIVIMLTGHASGEDRVAAWRAGADDFLVKPCEIPELLAHVAAYMRHREAPLQQWRNLVTGLPAAAALEEDLQRRVQQGEPFALCFADIAHFKSYNNRYGYVAGDALLAIMADVLRDITNDLHERSPTPGAVVAGHLSSDDFLLIAPPFFIDEAHRLLKQKFAEIAPSLYQSVDRDRGWVPGTDHLGAAQQFPLVGLATAVLPWPTVTATIAELEGTQTSIVARLWHQLQATTVNETSEAPPR